MTYDPATYWPERYARQGETYVAQGGRRESYDAQIELVVPHFRHLPTEGRVLDFGCGPGRFRPHLEAHGLTYDGFDIIPGLGTVEAIEPVRYDCAVALYVLQHIVEHAEYVEAMEAIRRGLRPGGTLLVLDAYPMEEPHEHMRPRGPSAVTIWLDYVSCTPLDGGHWAGVFRR